MRCTLFHFFLAFGDTMKTTLSFLGLMSVGTLILSGCASTRGDYSVPVVDATPTSSGATASVRRPVATAEIPEAGMHIVRKGDTIRNVSARYGLTWQELAAMNNLADPNHIAIGQSLRVNASARMPASGSVADSAVEVRPLSSESGDESVAVKPRSQKIPYSDETWNAAQREKEGRDGVAKVQVPAEAVSKQPYSDDAWKKNKDSATDVAGEAEEDIHFLWPTAGRVLRGFSGTNKGLDIAGKAGQPILASEAGKVVYVGSALRGYGKLVILKHSKQFLTAYAHNREIFVKDGQEVNRGQKIAEMGSTDSEQVKLHFEVRRLGKPVDPIKYLPER